MIQLINDNWEFLKLPNGSSLSDAKENTGWTPVDLPHDWLIWQSDDLYESADAWYRRNIRIDGNLPPVCLICFDGVYMDCDILLNDELIDTHPYGYTAFTVNLGGHLRAGTDRCTAVPDYICGAESGSEHCIHSVFDACSLRR